MNITQWRSDDALVEWAQKEPQFRLAVEAVEQSRGLVDCPVGPGMTESRLLGRREGYDWALIVLKTMTVAAPTPAQILEPDFGAGGEGE